MKPFLRWAGSKRQHLNLLADYIPKFSGKYIEPFAGSACLYWRLKPAKAILGDLNPSLINCYKSVAAAPEAVFEAYNSCSNDKTEYYKIRTTFRDLEDEYIRSGYFIYLNRYCFNGLWRTDRNGNFNVPYGGERTGSMPTLQELQIYSEQLQKTTFICDDFESVVLDNLEEGDFVYLDPPYFSSTIRVFNSYTKSPFNTVDLIRFENLLHKIHNSGAFFLASYLEGEEIAAIASKWQQKDITVLRRMSGFTAGRKKIRELVFTNTSLVTK